VKREGKNTVYRFRTLFKDLPLKCQNFTVKIQKILPFTDFQTPPPHLKLKLEGSRAMRGVKYVSVVAFRCNIQYNNFYTIYVL
jgi:hypothetical protein